MCPENNAHLVHQEHAPACSYFLEFLGVSTSLRRIKCLLGIPIRASMRYGLEFFSPPRQYPHSTFREMNGRPWSSKFSTVQGFSKRRYIRKRTVYGLSGIDTPEITSSVLALLRRASTLTASCGPL